MKCGVMCFVLSERKKKILQAVINENIKSAEPISSKDLQEKYFSSVSSATIRNELNGLEEMGYLSHLHTSSGRVPTTTGFKKYIEELMPEKELTKTEIKKLQDNFNTKISGIEELAVVSAKTISEATNYASIVYLGISEDAVINNVKLVKLLENLCLLIIVTDLGVIKDITIEIPSSLTEEDCTTAGKFVTEVIGGKTLNELSAIDVKEKLMGDLQNYRNVFNLILSAIIERSQKKVVKYDGTSNLLSLPEYKSIDKAKKAISIFEDKKVLTPLLEGGTDLEVSISVGTDPEEDCSVVSATYKINGKQIGKAGVVGPVRMDYAKAVSVLKQINQTIAQNVSLGYKEGHSTNCNQQNTNNKLQQLRCNKNLKGDAKYNGRKNKRSSTKDGVQKKV